MPYIITEKTNALISLGSHTRVIEVNNSFVINTSLPQIITYSCFQYGSTLEGRQKATAHLIKSSYKPPIVLKEQDSLILIPTHSLRNKCCCYVTLNNILSYEPYLTKNVLIEFKNHQKIPLNISYNIFDKQVLRATRLESALRGRNNKKPL